MSKRTPINSNQSNVNKHYKFKEMLVYATDESLAGDTKKYRKVFETTETRYIYCELSFYNKLFDEEDWEGNFALKAFQLHTNGTRTELCDRPSQKTITKDKNIVYVREGWGNATPGAYWFRGDYEWEAFINGEKVGTIKFYVENAGLVTESENPYFEIESVKMYNGPSEGIIIDSRKYQTQFQFNNTQYIWIETKIKNLQTASWYCELFFNIYNDAGQLKGKTTEIKYLAENVADAFIETGWGAQHKESWYADKYTLEIIFMDQLIAVVPFEVGEEEIEGIPQVHKPDGQLFYGNTTSNAIDKELSFEELMKELKEMIGLTSIKDKLEDFTHYLKFLKLRQEQGFKENEKMSLHSVFMGNPGTGKTTVARLIAKIYHKLGLLSKGKLVEVGRAELVGKFIGQTAPKVQELIEKARGGILFIDEAYSLARKGEEESNDFGREVIEVLIKEMSDGKGDLAVIVAGYPAEMDFFLESNPGLKSRFNLIYHFADYLPQELMQILTYKSEQKDVHFNEESLKFIQTKITDLYRDRDKNFGNARLITSIVEEAKMNMGMRIVKQGNYESLTPELMKEISLADVQGIFKTSKSMLPQIDVDEALLQESMNDLNELIGLSKVKEEVNELVKLIRFYKESGKDVLNKFSFHTVFTGNPGTGKTTVARIISKIYKALGVLERGHLVEGDRSSLVAGFIGQTALKTQEKIKQAMGGVLFIDEAYSLSQAYENDFGKEAIETLLKQMEDNRGAFAVIAAGYPDNMRTFLQMNPGLASRFDVTLQFEDYNKDELFQIAVNLLQNDGLQADQAAEEHLRTYFEYLYDKRDKFFGNARSIRKVISQAIKNQHLRMASLPKETRTPEAIATLTLADVEEFNTHLETGNQGSIGFQIGKAK